MLHHFVTVPLDRPSRPLDPLGVANMTDVAIQLGQPAGLTFHGPVVSVNCCHTDTTVKPVSTL